MIFMYKKLKNDKSLNFVTGGLYTPRENVEQDRIEKFYPNENIKMKNKNFDYLKEKSKK